MLIDAATVIRIITTTIAVAAAEAPLVAVAAATVTRKALSRS